MPSPRPFDWTPIPTKLTSLGLGHDSVRIASAAPDRDTYLRRPDLGRRLQRRQSRQVLADRVAPDAPTCSSSSPTVLSSTGVAGQRRRSSSPSCCPLCKKSEWSIGPVLLASQARVALGDDAAEILNARAVLVLIGERPGLSSPDSLGAYLTLDPRNGRKDGERNCVSNIQGRRLAAAEAAFKIHWLLREAYPPRPDRRQL